MPEPAPAVDLRRLVAEQVGPVASRYVGLAVGVMAARQQAVVELGRPGGAATEAPDGRTIFQIGSITKVVTSLLLADGIERGEVDLDQPLATLVPGVAAHPRGRPITLEDLATHTAGLPRLPPGLVRQALRNRADP